MKTINLCHKAFIVLVIEKKESVEMKTIVKKIVCKLVNKLNHQVKKTWWYKSNYSDAVKMKNWQAFNLELVTLGSSAVKYGLDYSGYKINAANWAMAPQNTATSFAILKNYHSFIKENGQLLLMLCPLQGMVIDYNKEFYDKYHYFLHPILVKHFSEETLKRVRKTIDYPALDNPKASVKLVIKNLLGKANKPQYSNAKTDAQNRINAWKKEFSVENFSDQLSESNLKAIEYNTNLFCEMIEFCKERSLKPILGIMPTTKTLKDHIPTDFMQRAFYDMVQKVIAHTNVPFLDYYNSSEFESEDLYLDSFLLNEKGRKLFTDRVLKDLNFSTDRKYK